MDPRNRVVIISGASSGIGAATARVFASSGAQLVLAARSHERLQQLAADLPGRPLVVPTDVAQRDQCRALIEQTVKTYGRLDILINNAGIGISSPVVRIDPDELQQAFAVDFYGPLHLIQAAVPAMQRQGRGQIINVSSVLSVQPLPYLGGYAAAKAALDRLSEALRMELHASGIRITVVRPGKTQTDFNARRLGRGSERRRLQSRGVPPELVARTLLRAARREPRLAYVTVADRIGLIAAQWLPGPIELLLARTISWEDPSR
jgi:short-subunit dehydrogenase